jgi:hypothetical protein
MSLTERTIDCSRLGASDKRRNVRRVGVAVADKAFAILGSEDCGFECPTPRGWIAKCSDRRDSDTSASPSVRETQEPSMRDVPTVVEIQHVPSRCAETSDVKLAKSGDVKLLV